MTAEDVVSRVRQAEQSAGREAGSVCVVAVSKVQPIDRVKAALAGGQRRFGENRVQEAQERWGALRSDYPDLVLHLIGPLQTNKVRAAVALFDVIESVDREKLARKLAEEMAAQGRRLPVFVQVNTGAEGQKAGASVEDAPALVDLCRNELGLDVRGLMAIPPADEPPAPHFALLKKMADELGLPELSMGMSGDFETAIAMGSTEVRVGSAFFGARVKPEA